MRGYSFEMKKSKSPVMGDFCDHVTVVTAKLGEKENVMPATWAVSVSFSPQLVAVNIAPERYTHGMIKKSGKFGLCLLADDQADVSRKLSSCSGRDANKFSKFKELKKFYGETGIPLIDGCVACIECKVVDAVTEGDHTVFTGEVVNIYADEKKKPLLLFRGGYFSVGESKGSY